MRATTILFLLLFSALVAALTFVIIYSYVPQESPGMGRGTGPQFYIWIPLVSVPVTFSIGLLAYLALFPEIERTAKAETPQPKEPQPIDAVIKVLKEDEKKVIELIMNQGGTMLQRDIARKTGFTRVKTHRILYRLTTRGIVTAKKHYNTYEITLADWLLKTKP